VVDKYFLLKERKKMKRLFILAFFLIGIARLQASDYRTSNANLFANEKINDCRYGQCSATAKSTGLRCKHCVSKSGDLYCWQHK